MTEKEIEDIKREFGDYLWVRRKHSGIRIHDIFHSHGMRHDTVTSIEDGSRNYTIDNLIKYLDSIGYIIAIMKKI